MAVGLTITFGILLLITYFVITSVLKALTPFMVLVLMVVAGYLIITKIKKFSKLKNKIGL